MEAISSLGDIAHRYDVLVFDQWGVLHNGQAAYGDAPQVLTALQKNGHRMAVLSNSGKRADINAARLASFGFAQELFDAVMSSGEAFWLDIKAGRVSERCFLPIVARDGDAEIWARGLDLMFCKEPEHADAILLMGLPEGSDGADATAALDIAAERRLTVYCTNPDHASPRAEGVMQLAPGALATRYADNGGRVAYYGKPHGSVFEALARQLNARPERLIMVGDSPAHDIAGAALASWASVFVQGGLHRADFERTDDPLSLVEMLTSSSTRPDYTIFEIA